MFEYEIDGVIYEVPQNEQDEFLRRFPNAKKVQTADGVSGNIPINEQNRRSEPIHEFQLGEEVFEVPDSEKAEFENRFKQEAKLLRTVVPEKQPQKETTEDGEEKNHFDNDVVNFLEDVPIIGGIVDWIDDSARAVSKGFRQGQSAQAAYELAYGEVTDEDISNFLELNANAQEIPESQEMKDFNKVFDESGGGVLGFVKGFWESPTIATELAFTSLAQLANKTSLKAAGGVTSTFAGAGAIGGGGPGAVGGAVASLPYAFGAASGAIEIGSSLSEFIQEEIQAKKLNLDEAGIRAVLDDAEAMKRIKQRAVTRGIVIGAVDAFTGRLATSVGRKALADGASNVSAVTRGLGVEAVGGGAGESIARASVGQKQDIKEIGFEAIGGLGTGSVNVASAFFKPNEYIVNGERRPRQEVVELLDTTDPAVLGKIEIKNDPDLQKTLAEKKREINIRKESNGNEEIVELQKKLDTLGEPTTVAGKARKKQIEDEIKEKANQPAPKKTTEKSDEVSVLSTQPVDTKQGEVEAQDRQLKAVEEKIDRLVDIPDAEVVEESTGRKITSEIKDASKDEFKEELEDELKERVSTNTTNSTKTNKPVAEEPDPGPEELVEKQTFQVGDKVDLGTGYKFEVLEIAGDDIIVKNNQGSDRTNLNKKEFEDRINDSRDSARITSRVTSKKTTAETTSTQTKQTETSKTTVAENATNTIPETTPLEIRDGSPDLSILQKGDQVRVADQTATYDGEKLVTEDGKDFDVDTASLLGNTFEKINQPEQVVQETEAPGNIATANTQEASQEGTGETPPNLIPEQSTGFRPFRKLEEETDRDEILFATELAGLNTEAARAARGIVVSDPATIKEFNKAKKAYDDKVAEKESKVKTRKDQDILDATVSDEIEFAARNPKSIEEGFVDPDLRKFAINELKDSIKFSKVKKPNEDNTQEDIDASIALDEKAIEILQKSIKESPEPYTIDDYISEVENDIKEEKALVKPGDSTIGRLEEELARLKALKKTHPGFVPPKSKKKPTKKTQKTGQVGKKKPAEKKATAKSAETTESISQNNANNSNTTTKEKPTKPESKKKTDEKTSNKKSVQDGEVSSAQEPTKKTENVKKTNNQVDFEKKVKAGLTPNKALRQLAEEQGKTWQQLATKVNTKPKVKIRKDSIFSLDKNGYPQVKDKSIIDDVLFDTESTISDDILEIEGDTITFSPTADLDIIASRLEAIVEHKKNLQNKKC